MLVIVMIMKFRVAVVTSGVSEGDKVVTLGVQKLEAGLKVRTVELR